MRRVAIGGNEYAVGGWGEYELGRREASAEEPGSRYPGGGRVGLADAVDSILRARPRPTPLKRAAESLAAALAALEAEPWGAESRTKVVLPLCSAELRALPADPPEKELQRLAAAAAAAAALAGRPQTAPPAASRERGPAGPPAVEAADGEGVRRLEEAAAALVEEREEREAELAELFGAVEAAVGAGRSRRFGGPR
jgi:hypothetical protein